MLADKGSEIHVAGANVVRVPGNGDVASVLEHSSQ
jgi:hypothetical protein